MPGPRVPDWLADASGEAADLVVSHKAFGEAVAGTIATVFHGRFAMLPPANQKHIHEALLALVGYTLVLAASRRAGIGIDQAHATCERFCQRFTEYNEILEMVVVAHAQGE